MCVFRDIRGWRSSALQSPRLGTMAASPDVDSELMPSWFKFLTTIRDQGIITRMIMIMMRIEMIKMRMGRRAKWREEPVAKNK